MNKTMYSVNPFSIFSMCTSFHFDFASKSTNILVLDIDLWEPIRVRENGYCLLWLILKSNNNNLKQKINNGDDCAWMEYSIYICIYSPGNDLVLLSVFFMICHWKNSIYIISIYGSIILIFFFQTTPSSTALTK